MKKLLYTLIIFYHVSLSLLSQAQPKTPVDSKYITQEVQLQGLVENPLRLTVASLKEKQIVKGQNFQVTSPKGEVRKTFESYKGVLLKDLLNEANIKMHVPKDRGKYYILVSGSDGYKVLFSWNEIYSSATGDQVFLLFEENGKEITEDGKFVLIAAGDQITGPRHVKWVKTIEVAKVE